MRAWVPMINGTENRAVPYTSASSAPESTAGLTAGGVTVRSVLNGPAPLVLVASSSPGSRAQLELLARQAKQEAGGRNADGHGRCSHPYDAGSSEDSRSKPAL
ncbi:hypothetical protein GCM10017788_56490 [Amycolatopsis acidiphila]|nr:hypothetical protein GCM10017788_56490 [Amycolatopsis acidiphila]